MTPMTEETIEIVCGLCSCHFSFTDLKEDEILCDLCGHSLDDDHAAGTTIEQGSASP
jgi:hypothetical protein